MQEKVKDGNTYTNIMIWKQGFAQKNKACWTSYKNIVDLSGIK